MEKDGRMRVSNATDAVKDNSWEEAVEWVAATFVLISLAVICIASISLLLIHATSLTVSGCCTRPLVATFSLTAQATLLMAWVSLKRVRLIHEPFRMMPVSSSPIVGQGKRGSLWLGLATSASLGLLCAYSVGLPMWAEATVSLVFLASFFVLAVLSWQSVAQLLAISVPVISILFALTAPRSSLAVVLMLASLTGLLVVGWSRHSGPRATEALIELFRGRAIRLRERLEEQDSILAEFGLGPLPGKRYSMKLRPSELRRKNSSLRALQRTALLLLIAASAGSLVSAVIEHFFGHTEMVRATVFMLSGTEAQSPVVDGIAATLSTGHWYIGIIWGSALAVWLFVSLEGYALAGRQWDSLERLVGTTISMNERRKAQEKLIEEAARQYKRAADGHYSWASPGRGRIHQPHHSHEHRVKSESRTGGHRRYQSQAGHQKTQSQAGQQKAHGQAGQKGHGHRRQHRQAGSGGPTTPKLNHYSVLGVSPDAPQDSIQKAYRRLAKRYHPDTAGMIGEEIMKKVNAAYTVLSDPARRSAYDRESQSAI